MSTKHPIDERDIDDLLASLTDRQIADLFGMSEEAVAKIRRRRRAGDAGTSPGHGRADGSENIGDDN